MEDEKSWPSSYPAIIIYQHPQKNPNIFVADCRRMLIYTVQIRRRPIMSDERALAPASSQPDQPQKSLARYMPAPDPATGNQLAPLSVPQQAALNALAAGCSVRRAAREAKVDHRTVRRWIHQNAQFAAACNARQQELLESARVRAVEMLDAALATIDAAIRQGDVNAALHMVRHLGILQPPNIGPADASELQRRRAVADARREARLREAEESLIPPDDSRPTTTEDLNRIIAAWQRVRHGFIIRDARQWGGYERRRDLPEYKDDPAPTCPRPTDADLLAALQWDAVDSIGEDVTPHELERHIKWMLEMIGRPLPRPRRGRTERVESRKLTGMLPLYSLLSTSSSLAQPSSSLALARRDPDCSPTSVPCLLPPRVSQPPGR